MGQRPTRAGHAPRGEGAQDITAVALRERTKGALATDCAHAMQQPVMLILRKQIYPAAAPKARGLNARLTLIIVGLARYAHWLHGCVQVIHPVTTSLIAFCARSMPATGHFCFKYRLAQPVHPVPAAHAAPWPGASVHAPP